MLFGAAALEVELNVVQRVANLLEGSFRIVVGITISKHSADFCQTPPLA